MKIWAWSLALGATLNAITEIACLKLSADAFSKF